MNQTVKELKIMESPNGIFLVDLRDMIGNVLANQGSWEQHLQDFYAHYIEESDHIIDAGANIGYLTVQFAKRCSKVYAFEPSVFNLELLESKVLYDDVKKDIQNNKKEYLKLLSELIPDDNDIVSLLNKVRTETEADENNLFNQIESTFWTKFETDLKNNNNDSLLKILEEIKNIFASFTPNRKDLLERLETGLNIQYIKLNSIY